MRHAALSLFLAILLVAVSAPGRADDGPLPSWRDGASQQAILDFVARVTNPRSPDFVPAEERIAVFDNDGTLWAEQPMYVQLRFALDRIVQLAPQHPEWKQQDPYRAVLAGDPAALSGLGMKDVVELINTTHAGMTLPAFRKVVADWLATARHPRFDRPYTELTYAPMVELLAMLRATGFRVWIVSGGGVDFMRVFAEEVYGVVPEQTIGSEGNYRFEREGHETAIVKEPGVARVNDKEGKPVGIATRIGRRPILAFGNSDGDLAMLRYTADQERPSLCLYVHHDDEEREWAYDRASHVGRLDEGLDEAKARGWTVVSMKRDWRRVFAFQDAAD